MDLLALRMLVDEIESKFPPGIQVPQSIRSLCEFIEDNGYPLSGCFELSTIGDADLQAWFPNDLAMQRQFAVFGRGSTGSVYALWLRDGRDVDNSPVIVLGSEGELLVLAVNPREFCRLLGCGYDELEWDDLSQPAAEWENTRRLREYLCERLGLSFQMTGESIVLEARDQYPDFASDIEAWWHTNSP